MYYIIQQSGEYTNVINWDNFNDKFQFDKNGNITNGKCNHPNLLLFLRKHREIGVLEYIDRDPTAHLLDCRRLIYCPITIKQLDKDPNIIMNARRLQRKLYIL